MSRGEFPSDWPAPNEWLIAMGRIPILWAALESQLEMMITKLHGNEDFSDPRTFIILNQSSFHAKMQMLGALCDYLKSEYPQLSGYKATISSLERAATVRNKFMHDGFVYNSDKNTAEMHIMKARGSLKFKKDEVTLDDIINASRKIHDAQRSLHKLVLGREINSAYK